MSEYLTSDLISPTSEVSQASNRVGDVTVPNVRVDERYVYMYDEDIRTGRA